MKVKYTKITDDDVKTLKQFQSCCSILFHLFYTIGKDKEIGHIVELIEKLKTFDFKFLDSLRNSTKTVLTKYESKLQNKEKILNEFQKTYQPVNVEIMSFFKNLNTNFKKLNIQQSYIDLLKQIDEISISDLNLIESEIKDNFSISAWTSVFNGGKKKSYLYQFDKSDWQEVINKEITSDLFSYLPFPQNSDNFELYVYYIQKLKNSQDDGEIKNEDIGDYFNMNYYYTKDVVVSGT